MKSDDAIIVTFGKPDGFHDIHIGHLSGVILHADTYVQYCRANGIKAFLISGTDGYGTSVYQHAFNHYNHCPTKEEIKSYVLNYHLRQKETLNHYQVKPDYYGLDIDDVEAGEIQLYCYKVLRKLIDSGTCELREEIEYRDPIMNCPLGNRQLKAYKTEEGFDIISLATNIPVDKKKVKNYFVSLEAFRPQIEASLNRFIGFPSDSFVISYIKEQLKKHLPDYRLTSYQPWALPVNGSSDMKYQVWVESLLSPIVYTHKILKQQNMENNPYRYIQFISEDTLFFYTIIQPVLWHVLNPNMPLPSLLCNRTRTFKDDKGRACFLSGDDLLSIFTVEQIRLCFIGRGTGNTSIALTSDEMNRLWKGYGRVARKIQNNALQRKAEYDEDIVKTYNSLIERLDFSKAIDLMDEYFHKPIPEKRTCLEMMRYIVPQYAEDLKGGI